MAPLFEHETCSRCGGTGHYSYCQMYGTTCFKCAGSGFQLTARGKAAAAFLRKLRTVKGAEVKFGDFIKVSGVPGFSSDGWFKVETIYTDLRSGKSLQPDGTWKEWNHLCFQGTDNKGASTGLHTFADADVQLVPTKAQSKEQRAAALAYQATLTKAGKVSKRRA